MPVQPPDLVIFDCDGVLVDSEGPANRLLCEAINRAGLDISEQETNRELNGLTMASTLEIIEHRLGRALPSDFLPRLQERTFEAFRHELKAVPGIHDAIARIDLPDCVASSGEIEKMRFTLGLTGLLDHFEGRLFSATQVARGKPAPDVFLFAAEQMGVAPDRCVVVEDAVAGVQAARAAGMPVFAYAGHDYADTDALRQAGGQIFSSMADLPVLLGRTP
jgi:HAD superfamily hydrolase (TIGR01509 family)